MYVWALHDFPALGIRLDATTQLSSSTLIFMWYLLLTIAIPIKPALQRHEVIRRNVGPFNITTWNNLELVIYMVSDRY